MGNLQLIPATSKQVSNQKTSNKDLSHIELNILSEDEAMSLLKGSLNGKVDASDDDLRNLAKKLQYFPLALQQAIAYILQEVKARQNTTEKYTIQEYIQALVEKEKAIEQLDFKFEDDYGDTYTKTVFTTWEITFDAIKNNKKYGSDAIILLENIAYFAADDIDFDLIKPLISNSKDMGHATELLKNYSLINESKGVRFDNKKLFNIDRLVQKVVQIKNVCRKIYSFRAQILFLIFYHLFYR